MVKIANSSSDVKDAKHRHPEIEQFLSLNTILHSLVDFIRPETYIAQDELQTYNESKDKFLREAINKRNKRSLEIAGVQSIRSTSGIYRFLAHHQKTNSSTKNNKQKSPAQVVSREELLKKLHDKMPYRQQQAENGEDHAAKRQRSKDKSNEPKKRPKPAAKEWKPTPTSEQTPSSADKSPTVPNQITFGRFEFKTEDSVDLDSKKKHKGKKVPTKTKKTHQHIEAN